MLITTAFEPGSLLFHLEEKQTVHRVCAHCLGRGKIAARSRVEPCPHCGASGRLAAHTTSPWAVTGPHEVRAVHVRFEADELTTVYLMRNIENSVLFFEENLFVDAEAARREAVRRTTWYAREEASA